MKKISVGLLWLFVTLLFNSCNAQEPLTEGPYTYKSGDYSGIGKWYMDREIAHVMGYLGMSWLERPEREQEERTTLLLENMDIQATDNIADIGAGSGYHVFKMAPIASGGTVYAVDIQDEMLGAIESRMKDEGVSNVSTVKGSIESVNLPANSVDKVLIVDVYHEMSHPVEMMASIYKAMRPQARLYLIEYRGEDDSVPIKRLHKMTESQAVMEMQAAGFRLEENMGNLPLQHCMVFVKM